MFAKTTLLTYHKRMLYFARIDGIKDFDTRTHFVLPAPLVRAISGDSGLGHPGTSRFSVKNPPNKPFNIFVNVWRGLLAPLTLEEQCDTFQHVGFGASEPSEYASMQTWSKIQTDFSHSSKIPIITCVSRKSA